VIVDVDVVGCRHLGQPGHRHDVAGHHHDEARAGREADLADVDGVPGRGAAAGGIGGERALRLGHADRQAGVAVGLDLREPLGGLGVERDRGSAVDLRGDGLGLVGQRELVGVDELHLTLARLDGLEHTVGQRLGTGATVAEVRRLVGASTLGADEVDERGDLGVGVGGEAVDRDHGRQAVDVLDVAQVLAQVLHATREGVDVLGLQVGQGDATVVLQGADGRHHDDRARAQP
jgi:hypothetical protein